MIDLKELTAKFEKELLKEGTSKISGTDYLLYKDSSDVGIVSDEGGAILLFKNKAAAISAAKGANKSGLLDYMEYGMDGDLSWGADKGKAQSDMKSNGVDSSVIKSVVGIDSGEGISRGSY
jgi:hypothetical protein